MSSPAAPAPVSGIAPPRPPPPSPPPLPQPFAPPPPSETTGRSRTPRTTAATSPWARIAPAFAATPASSPASAASPSTSSRPTAEAHSPRTASALPSVASITSSTFSASHSVEQPCATLEVGQHRHTASLGEVDSADGLVPRVQDEADGKFNTLEQRPEPGEFLRRQQCEEAIARGG